MIVVHLAFLHLPAGFHYLKPAHVTQGLVRSLDRGLDRLRDGLLPRTGNLKSSCRHDPTSHAPDARVAVSVAPRRTCGVVSATLLAKVIELQADFRAFLSCSELLPIGLPPDAILVLELCEQTGLQRNAERTST